MSEYQYYEFQALDRALTPDEQRDLAQLSSRAQITARSFVSVYNYGSFRGNVRHLIEECFDAFIYVANWGHRRLIFRLPAGCIPLDAARAYALEDVVSIRATSDATFVEWEWREEAWGGWEDGSGWMSSLVPLRDELLRGDLSSLYLGWLSGIGRAIGCEDLDSDAPTPPPPPGFGDLSAAGEALMHFLQLEPALVALASESAPPAAPEPDWDDLAAALAELSADEKDLWLMRLFEAEESNLSQLFIQRLCQEIDLPSPATAVSARLLSAGELLERSRSRAEEMVRAEAVRRAEEATRLRGAELDALEGREEHTWAEVGERIEEKQARSYDLAVSQLVDLRDLAIRQGEEHAFRARLCTLLSQFSTRPALMKRLKMVNLRPEP